jgi:hypothetical protein
MNGNNAERALTAAQAIEVAEMRRAGHSWQACAVRVGRNEASLRRAMKRFDVPTRRIDDELPPPTARSEAPAE